METETPPEILIDNLLDEVQAGDGLRRFVKTHDHIRPGVGRWHEYTDGVAAWPEFEKTKRAEAKDFVLAYTFDRIKSGKSAAGRPPKPPQLSEISERKEYLETLKWESEAFISALPELVGNLCGLWDRNSKLESLGKKQAKHFAKAADAAELMGRELVRIFDLYKKHQQEVIALDQAGMIVTSEHVLNPTGMNEFITKEQIQNFVRSVRETFNFESSLEEREKAKAEKTKADEKRGSYMRKHKAAVQTFRSTSEGKASWKEVKHMQQIVASYDKATYDDPELLASRGMLRKALISFYEEADRQAGIKPQSGCWPMPAIQEKRL